MGIDLEQAREIVSRALAEDIGTGDVTTESLISPTASARARIFAKEEGILAGLEVAGLVFRQLDPDVAFDSGFRDGAWLPRGAEVATVAGATRAMLSGERVALNLLQRMCGIATMTNRFVRAVEGTTTKILDTRKTTPGLRPLERYAVRVGGGENYRQGLFDMVLIKDNHIAACGGITAAVRRVQDRLGTRFTVVVEARTLEQVEEALRAPVNRIMLDNMSIPRMRKATALVAGRVPLEASGRMTLQRTRRAAEIGVDYVSIGALTSSPRSLDLSMELLAD